MISSFCWMLLDSKGHLSLLLIPGLASGLSFCFSSARTVSQDLIADTQATEAERLPVLSPSSNDKLSRSVAEVYDGVALEGGKISLSSSNVAAKASTSVMIREISSSASLIWPRIW